MTASSDIEVPTTLIDATYKGWRRNVPPGLTGYLAFQMLAIPREAAQRRDERCPSSLLGCRPTQMVSARLAE
jgi:hypothetical protein